MNADRRAYSAYRDHCADHFITPLTFEQWDQERKRVLAAKQLGYLEQIRKEMETI